MLLSYFTLFNSNIYCSCIHCSVPKIHFCACWSLLLSFSAALTLSQTLHVKPWQPRHFFFCLTMAHKVSNITLDSDLLTTFIWKRQTNQCVVPASDFRYKYSGAFSQRTTHLHYVVDQRVAEHPVQVDALILQNVLQITTTTKKKKRSRKLFNTRGKKVGFTFKTTKSFSAVF